jgi:hypothetical protein
MTSIARQWVKIHKGLIFFGVHLLVLSPSHDMGGQFT